MTSTPPTPAPPPGTLRDVDLDRRIVFVPANVWRTGWVVVALLAIVAFLRFVVADGGSVIFTLVMAWFFSLAMEPTVARLSRRMKRGAATAIIMVALGLVVVLFLLAFGQLFVQQVAQLVRAMPTLLDSLITWVNARLDTSYVASDILGSLNLTPAQASSYATTVLGGALSLVGSVANAVFSLISTLLLAFYLSADGPRLKTWVGRLLPATAQRAFVEIWDLTLSKTGGYVAARVVLASINAATSAVVFVAIGLPSWLALAVWTGLVAQFIPTIGTYVSILLPVLVGLLSDRPWTGLVVLAWAVVYQQVENLTLEPRISARAVDVHPAVSFAAVLLGASLFGIGGALLAVPVAAMLLAIVQERGKRHELVPDLLPADLVNPPEHAEPLSPKGSAST